MNYEGPKAWRFWVAGCRLFSEMWDERWPTGRTRFIRYANLWTSACCFVPSQEVWKVFMTGCSVSCQLTCLRTTSWTILHGLLCFLKLRGSTIFGLPFFVKAALIRRMQTPERGNLFSFSFLKFYLVCVFERQRERQNKDAKTEIFHLLVYSPSNWELAMLIQELGTLPRSPVCVAGTQWLELSPLPPRLRIRRKLESRAEQGL